MITTGEGKFYSNGLDVSWLTALAQAGRRDDVVAGLEEIGSVSARIMAFPIPTIAAINGQYILFHGIYSNNNSTQKLMVISIVLLYWNCGIYRFLGHSYAFGAVLSLCHDYRIMQTGRGWWCLNEVHNGLAFVPATQAVIK